MPKLILTNAKGKQRATTLVAASNSQQLNDNQKRDLEQINRRLPPEILGNLSARGLTISPREIDLLLSRLKGAAEVNISIAD